MTLEQAKEFYLRYSGIQFHMGREEPGLYSRFQSLGLTKDQLGIWDEEILADLFEKLWDNTENTWMLHSKISEVIQRKNCNIGLNTTRLLDEMEKMDALDEMNRILIIENMAGRDANFKSGMCCFICSYTGFSDRMNRIVKKIACVPAEYTPDRLEKAVKNYSSAYARYKR